MNKVTLTEADADSVITLLREMYAYRERDIEQTERDMGMFRDAVVQMNSEKGDDFVDKVYKNGIRLVRSEFQKETQRFQNAILLLTAGSNLKED